MLEQEGSAAILADLERSNLLLVPPDQRGEWYRYHHLFRDMLLAELGRRDPGLMPVLRRRAAAWCLTTWCSIGVGASSGGVVVRLAGDAWLPCGGAVGH
jgi:hypothetical protein